MINLRFGPCTPRTDSRGLRERIIMRSPGRPSGWSRVRSQGVRGSWGSLWRLPGGSWGLVWKGFGRLFAKGENRKMVRKCFRTHQRSPKNYQIVEQVMADPIFGVPGPGGPKKAENDRFWVPGKSRVWPIFVDPIIMGSKSPWVWGMGLQLCLRGARQTRPELLLYRVSRK